MDRQDARAPAAPRGGPDVPPPRRPRRPRRTALAGGIRRRGLRACGRDGRTRRRRLRALGADRGRGRDDRGGGARGRRRRSLRGLRLAGPRLGPFRRDRLRPPGEEPDPRPRLPDPLERAVGGDAFRGPRARRPPAPPRGAVRPGSRREAAPDLVPRPRLLRALLRELHRAARRRAGEGLRRLRPSRRPHLLDGRHDELRARARRARRSAASSLSASSRPAPSSTSAFSSSVRR